MSMKRGRCDVGDDEYEEDGVLWHRPSKRQDAFRMRLDVDVRPFSLSVDVDPWVPINDIVDDLHRRISNSLMNHDVLFINGQRCERGHQLSRYTNTQVTTGHLDMGEAISSTLLGNDAGASASASSTLASSVPASSSAAGAGAPLDRHPTDPYEPSAHSTSASNADDESNDIE